MKESQNPRKPLLYYYLIVLLIIMLLNIFVFPTLLQPRVTEVSYDQFLSLIESGRVKTCALDEYATSILFTADNPDTGREVYGKTGVWPDMQNLTKLLLEKGVIFGAE
ncbi:MAG: ATP-dependent metallopeptidase FtsH/Yme1/Tma family protein, partial [Clostridia bacterium]|nr:ATP-dependent metallopeptidase FtsH/Yme1/Tma family protein [Clostridia bacterium]